jgi:hypothetical protein
MINVKLEHLRDDDPDNEHMDIEDQFPDGMFRFEKVMK